MLRNDYIRAIKLFLMLSQWQALHDEPVTEDNWSEIRYWKGKIEACNSIYSPFFGAIRFSSLEKANEAIEVFRGELEWYFAEFKPRLDMGGV